MQPPREAGERVQLGHIAFRTDEPAAALIARVRAAGLEHEVARVPEQGEVQVFVALPGGLVIELDAPADAGLSDAEPAGHDGYRSTLALRTA